MKLRIANFGLRIALVVSLLAVAASAQFSPLCTVTGTIFDGVGQPAANRPITIVKVLKSGAVFSSIARTVYSNNAGVVTFTVPQNSIAYVYAQAYIGSLNLEKTGGVALTIPAASSATLESLGAAVTIPVTGLTLKDE
ncbi:MAG TPA: hypothetical protein VN743_03110, partial [Blastocatellia bacterium]|nr:hypothetical protein [Blastocatellia bacterium]